MKELQGNNTSSFQEIEKLLKEANEKFTELSNIMFKVADQFHRINENYIKIEEISSEKLEIKEQSSQYLHSELNERVKVGFYSFGELFKKLNSNIKKCIIPTITSIQNDSTHIHGVINPFFNTFRCSS